MTQRERLTIAGLIIPFALILDQWSKYLILKQDSLNALGCLNGTEYCGRIEASPLFNISMVWNRGMSFGQLQSEGIMRWVLVIVALAIGTGFLVWLFRATGRSLVIALSFVVAGAIGNVIDRIRFGAVVDFIDVTPAIPIFPWVFNVADSCITVGAILLLIDQFIFSRE
ncbi:MAG: signal peptidase II [Hyphomonadaceae bacterium]